MRDVIGEMGGGMMGGGMRDVIGEMGWGICGREGGYAGRGDMRDGPPPRNRPGRAAVFGPAPPQSTKDGKQER
jgi:hypothetical protein